MPSSHVIVSLLIAASLTACGDRTPHLIALPAAAELAKPGQMMITGSASLEISPDCADLTMTIAAEAPRPSTATKEAQAKQRQLVAALDKLEVRGADLKLSHQTLSPIHDHNPDGSWSQRIRGYRAEITITATTRRFELVGDLMDAGAAAGASTLSTQFRRSDMPALKKQVRDLALAAARDKAKQTTDALGIELGRIVSVVEGPGSTWDGTYANYANASDVRSSPATLGGTLQTLSLDVTIGYELAKPA
jgi:uncharacterized protein